MRTREELVRMFEHAGFTLIRAKSHKIWRCPCGHARVVTGSSPGEGRADRNARAMMERTLRACTR